MSRPNTWLSSKVSPVLIRCAARSTLAGVMWLPEPRSSVAPHFDGQRSLGDGGCQLCAVAFCAEGREAQDYDNGKAFHGVPPFLPLARSARSFRHERPPGGAPDEPTRFPVIS